MYCYADASHSNLTKLLHSEQILLSIVIYKNMYPLWPI
jgi:hypothetical protein